MEAGMAARWNRRLAILTSASGSGETTRADAIRTGCPGLAEVLHLDRIGTPSSGTSVWLPSLLGTRT